LGGGFHHPHGGRGSLKTELKVIRKNPLIGRREITFEIREPSTPSRAAVRRDIAVLTKADLDQIWVKSISTKTGTQRIVGIAHVYDDPKKALQVEPAYIIERNKIPEQQVEQVQSEGPEE
jgi:small subunit ribosomal protein S24e